MAKKDTFYFSHDYNCRNDQKIKKLLVKHGMQGYGIFWAIIEELYNNTNVLRTHYDSIAYELRVDENIVKSIVNDFDLFVFDGDTFGSSSIESRLEERNKKSLKARESVLKRWANIRTHYDSNTNVSKNDTIKESKVKESKVNEIVLADKSAQPKSFDSREKYFFDKVSYFVDEFSKETCRAFYDYWTEKNEEGKKMRFEGEKFFDIKKRLTTWKKRESKFEKPNYDNSTQTIKPKRHEAKTSEQLS